MSRHVRTAALAGLALAPILIAILAACDDGPAPAPQMAPAGSTPEQIRFFCTEESERAAAAVGFPPDYVAARQRAANAAFADCMTRHDIRP